MNLAKSLQCHGQERMCVSWSFVAASLEPDCPSPYMTCAFTVSYVQRCIKTQPHFPKRVQTASIIALAPPSNKY